MNIKKLNEELTNIVNEAKVWQNDINFTNLGCGFSVKISHADDKVKFYCEGYSNNTSKNLEFTSNIVSKDEDSYDKAEDLLYNNLMLELADAAEEFDKKVEEIFYKNGLYRSV